MDIFGFSMLVGGLAFFLYGMRLMGEGLLGIAGEKLERILGKAAASPGKAALTGIGITALVQSSSVVTVMAVGLTDSGVMELEQAAGIIMGANIGTTVTAWILGMMGISSGSVFIRMLRPTFFSPFLAAAGVAFLFLSRKERWRRAAVLMIGFAIVVFGMDTMSGSMEPLAGTQGFSKMLTCFADPVRGVAAGIATTAVMQSSSASIGTLQALCAAGNVSYGAAVPIVLGQNIGTCVTALLTGIGTGKNARCAALLHLYFNLIGTVIFAAVFYGINRIRPFAFLAEPANGLGIALIHSLFNIIAVIALLPFSGLLIKLARITVGGGERYQYF